MAIITQTINVDLRPHYNRRNQSMVYCSQYDNDLRNIVLNIANEGEPVDVSTYTIYIEGTKPDKHGFSYELTSIGGSVSNNVITVPLQTQMTAVAGLTNAEVVLYSNDERIGSANFILNVEKAGLAEDVDISETDIPAYVDGAQQAAAEATQAKDDAVSAKDTAVSAAETAQTVLDSIPEDYTELSDSVLDLKSALQMQNVDVVSGKSYQTLPTLAYIANFYGFAAVLHSFSHPISKIGMYCEVASDCTVVCEIYDHNVYGTLLASSETSAVAGTRQYINFDFNNVDVSSYDDIQIAISVKNNVSGITYSNLNNNISSLVYSRTGNFNRYKTTSGWVNLSAANQYDFMIAFDIYKEVEESARFVNMENTNTEQAEDITELKDAVDNSNLYKMNYVYVSNDYTSADDGYGTTKFNTIRSASNYISGTLGDNTEKNRYTVIVKNGTYTDMQSEYAGIAGTYYQGVVCRDWVYYESEDIMHPENCIIEWDGKTGFTNPVLSDVYNKCPFHVIGDLHNGIHTHIKGFTFNCKNLRYAFHTETQAFGIGAEWEISNCVINWGGRPDIASDTANSPVIGMGTSPFENGIIKDCVIKNIQTGNTYGVQDHTNPFASAYGFTPFMMKGANITIENCKFNGTDIQFRTGHDIYQTPNVLTIKGCSEVNHAYFGLLNNVTVQSWKADISCSDITVNDMD